MRDVGFSHPAAAGDDIAARRGAVLAKSLQHSYTRRTDRLARGSHEQHHGTPLLDAFSPPPSCGTPGPTTLATEGPYYRTRTQRQY